VDTGRSPEVATRAALEASAAAKTQSPDLADASNLSAWAHHLQAVFESDAGRDPTHSLTLAEESAHDVEKVAPASLMSYELRGMLASTAALHRLRRGDDPEPALREARSAFQHLVDKAPWDLGYRLGRANVEVLGLRAALRGGEIRKAQIEAARGPLLPMLDTDRAHPQLYLTLAEIHEIRASWLLAVGKANEEDVSKGLDMASKALAIHPKMAAALAVQGGLFLLRARAARDPDAKREMARAAKDAFMAALRENPLLSRDRSDTLPHIEQLVGEAATDARAAATPPPR
jgi:serine/threonine-protein kinase